jgi:mono/diheme cytochrome c family protein
VTREGKAPIRWVLFLSAVLFVVVGVGCLQQAGGESKRGPIETPAQTEEIDASLLFEINCASCHGPGGKGGVGIAPSLKESTFVQTASVEEVQQVIEKGRRYEEKKYPEFASAMPPWEEKLSTEEIAALVKYLKGEE